MQYLNVIFTQESATPNDITYFGPTWLSTPPRGKRLQQVIIMNNPNQNLKLLKLKNVHAHSPGEGLECFRPKILTKMLPRNIFRDLFIDDSSKELGYEGEIVDPDKHKYNTKYNKSHHVPLLYIAFTKRLLRWVALSHPSPFLCT